MKNTTPKYNKFNVFHDLVDRIFDEENDVRCRFQSVQEIQEKTGTTMTHHTKRVPGSTRTMKKNDWTDA